MVAVVALVAAVAALVRTRRALRRLERLSESYWELRYEYGQLNARVGHLEGGGAPGAGASASGQEPAGGTVGFVPISSLRNRQ